MKVTINYDLSDEGDKNAYFHHLQASKYARFIDDVFKDLRSADKYDSYFAIGLSTPTEEDKLEILSSFVSEYRDYICNLYGAHGIEEHDD